ncbi:DUF4199 domain-containing protein [Parabacteroides sp. OttesenSCG-928-G07]|nr:DUF4199 domain-containing protein [Parabacteroides sp. OttesenSCG-928-G21]MDL2278105.1 DUF4199 domain-containing protein [Parabacteroides sp. OttesenSCG-928-G07]
MAENKSLLLKASMTFGFLMGIYWCVKYVFFMLGVSSAFMTAIYWGMTFVVPVIAYRFTRRHKLMTGGKIGFFTAWQFGILLYTFAALLVSLEHYIFYRYLAPPELLSSALSQTIELLKQQSGFSAEQLEAISSLHLSPIQMTIQGIFNNIFYGIVFSLPVAAIVSRKEETLIPPPEINN